MSDKDGMYFGYFTDDRDFCYYCDQIADPVSGQCANCNRLLAPYVKEPKITRRFKE